MSTVAKFDIQYTQYLDHNGEILNPLPAIANNPDDLLEIYRIMVLTRVFDTKAIALQRTGKMGTYASTLGQEAIGTVIGYCLQADDVFLPFYRDYATMYQRSVALHEILTYWGGDERGSQYQDNAEDFPIAVPIASQCLHACGVAFSFKYRKQNRVALTTCGDGATSQGDFYEAINLAGAWQLPAVFVVNNNQWAISVPRETQTRAETLAQKAIAAGIPGIQVDGNDIFALHEALSHAIKNARDGNGPMMIEALTYRLCDHTTADDASRYRPDGELDEAWEREPIKRLRAYLTREGHWNDDKESKLNEACKAEVEEAVNVYLNREPQQLSDIFDYHYANMPDSLAEQKQSALEDDNA